MRIGIPKETAPGERRVAMVPDVARRLTGAGHEVLVERGAGVSAAIPDAALEAAGATVADAAARLSPPRRPPTPPPRDGELGALRAESVLIGFLNPLGAGAATSALAQTGATTFAMEAIPRISRAQSMDALSSQATVSGYLAVIIAAQEMPRFFPMLMTAAGTIPPAQLLVLGAGVAGLQAIATSRRLGAVVTAFDVRSAVKEQINSLGAKFFEVEGLGDAEGSGGYARELTPEEQERQREALTVQMHKSDVIITTALVPGRPAPKLVSRAAVEGMRPGAVIVDLAGETGGNCELSVPGETITTDGGVVISAPLNLPSEMAEHASQLYAKNVQALLELMTDKDADPPGLVLNWEDEVIAGACITRGGEIVHEGARKAAEGGRG